MSTPVAERVTYLVGGAALGAISYAAYQKFTSKPAAVRPAAIATAPTVPAQAPPAQQRTVDQVEKAKSILPFGFPGKRPPAVSDAERKDLGLIYFLGPVNDLLYRNAYVVSYNRRDRNPNWVAEHLTAASLQRAEGVDRIKSTFQEDPNIPPQFRARLADYFKSNFDRGHMVPAADVKFDQEAMNETFYLTNIAPQVGDGFNRDCKLLLSSMCMHW